MMNIVEYKKGANKGSVATVEYAGVTTFIAATASTSRSFKTLRGAEKFMSKMGYEKGGK